MYINTISIAFNQNDTILSSPNIITIDDDIYIYIYILLTIIVIINTIIKNHINLRISASYRLPYLASLITAALVVVDKLI